MAELDGVGGLGFLPWLEKFVPQIQLTPYQHAVARVVGGADPESVLEREVWGFAGRVERVHRRVIALRLGRGGFKSTLSALYGLWRGFTCDLSRAHGGSEVVCPIIGPDISKSKVALKMAFEWVENGPLRDCKHRKGFEGARSQNAQTQTELHLCRPHDGMHFELRAVAPSSGGARVRGFWVPAGVIDEAELLRSTSEAEITDKEQVDAMRPRLLDGGSILMISTPYDFESYMHKFVVENHGHPKTGIAAIAKTRQLRPDDAQLMQIVSDELSSNPDTALREYECIALGRPDSYFEATTLDRVTDESAQRTGSRVSAGCDLGFVRDGCALVVVERQGDTLVQVHEEFVQPTPLQPLQPSAIRARFRDLIKGMGCNHVSADVHEYSSLCETMLSAGIVVAHAPSGEKVTTSFALARDMMRAGKLRILPETAKQARRVMTNSKGGPEVPRTPGEGHADLVSALVNAVWLDRRHGPLGGTSGGFSPGMLRGGWST